MDGETERESKNRKRVGERNRKHTRKKSEKTLRNKIQGKSVTKENRNVNCAQDQSLGFDKFQMIPSVLEKFKVSFNLT